MSEPQWYRFTFLVRGEARDFRNLGEKLGGAVRTNIGMDAAMAATAVLFDGSAPGGVLIDNPHLAIAEAPDAMFEVYAHGLVYCAACTTLDDDTATLRVNASYPTGIGSEWHVADEAFQTGEANPHPCPDRPGCRHVLFSC